VVDAADVVVPTRVEVEAVAAVVVEEEDKQLFFIAVVNHLMSIAIILIQLNQKTSHPTKSSPRIFLPKRIFEENFFTLNLLLDENSLLYRCLAFYLE